MSKISKRCEYCVHGKLAADGETVLCIKKGPVERDYFCRKYKYDILKREPRKPVITTDINPEQFEL